MWKLLYKLACPKVFYNFSAQICPYLFIFSSIFLIIGLSWGLFFAPPDYLQKDAFRIIYVHVPCAFLSMALFAGMGFLAFLVLVWRIKLAGIMLHCVANVGIVMTFLALCTGSIWGKPMWGAWWVWDARLTSELILLLIYAAILTLNSYRQMAVLTLVGLIDLPIIHYSVYWWNTLHQTATISIVAKPKIHPSMLWPLLISLLGFVLYSIWLILKNARLELLLQERRQSWVKRIVEL